MEKNIMTLLVSGDTNIGQKRSSNQDSICIYPKRNFFAVADGMGGHNGGDIASQMSVKLLPEYIDENLDKLSTTELLSQAVRFVNKSIYEHGQKNQELKGMGTTITAIMMSGHEINIANVGDSRTYMLSNNMLFQMTRDHSLVQEKLNIGLYDREGAKADSQKNVLVRTVGFEPDVEVDVYQYSLSRNDIFMLCSDGLHGKVSDADMAYIITKNIPNPANATQELLDKTVAQLIDNISVIIALVK